MTTDITPNNSVDAWTQYNDWTSHNDAWYHEDLADNPTATCPEVEL